MEGDGGDGSSKAEPLPSLAPAPTMAAAPASTTTTTTEETYNHSSSSAARPQSTVAGLAKEAAQLFHARSYQGCLLILHQLQLHNDEDPKVGPRLGHCSVFRRGSDFCFLGIFWV